MLNKDQEAGISQSQCSTLRELKYKKLIERQKHLDGDVKDIEQYHRILADLAAINRVLKLISDMPPVA